MASEEVTVHEAVPWEANPAWQGGVIRSTAKQEMWVLTGFCLVWNAFSFPMAWLVGIPELTGGNKAALLVFLFPLAGLWLAWMASRAIVQWRRFGKVTLSMDPFPGSLGGDVGGYIEVPVRFNARHRYQVSLSCVHVRISRNSKGGNSRHESVVWRDRGEPMLEAAGRGTYLHFRFAVPEDLPASESASSRYHIWVAHVTCELPGADLDRSFEIPVFKLERAARTAHRTEYTPERTAPEPLPPDIVEVKQSGDNLSLYYPLSRNRSLGISLLIFGAIFGGSTAFLGSQFTTLTAGGGIWALFAGSTVGFMVLIFGLVSGLLILAGLYELGNSLTVEISGNDLRTVRRVFGAGLSRYTPVDDIKQLESKITSQSGQGAKASVRYTLWARTKDGRRINIGDGIRGAPVFKQVHALVNAACKLPDSAPVFR